MLVFTHDPKLDVPALMAALRHRRGLHRRARQPQDDRGPRARACARPASTDDDLERLFAPCGLDIGAATVEETAIAVLAEIIAHRAGRHGVPLREASGPIRRDRGEDHGLVAPLPGAGAAG